MANEVGAGVLAEEAGVPLRTIQFWTDAGVLKVEPDSDRRGRGRHRVYRTEPQFGERACALIAREMQRMRVPVGMMRIAIDLIARREKHSLDDMSGPGIIEKALSEQQYYVVVNLLEGPETDENFNLVISGGPFLPPVVRSGYVLDLARILKPLREAK